MHAQDEPKEPTIQQLQAFLATAMDNIDALNESYSVAMALSKVKPAK